MPVSQFLVASRGRMATTWLTHALNALPSTLAIHDGKPVRVDTKRPLSEQLAFLRDNYPDFKCQGLVHSVNATSLYRAFSSGDLMPGQVKTVQLCRHPIMLADSMASVMKRDRATDLKFKTLAQTMCTSVREGRLHRAALDWPASVKTAIEANDDGAIARLTGIWNRTWQEAADLLFCSRIRRTLAKRGNVRGEEHPFFRYEDYTADRTVFGRLCNHLAGEPLKQAAIDVAFATPVANQHRSSAVTDPAEVYRGWTAAERDMFNTVLVVTGLAAFLANARLYDVALDWSDGPISYETPPKFKVGQFNTLAIFTK